MSAEPQRIGNTEAWTQWENQAVQGFVLRRFLGGSEHRAVFLTEHKSINLADAAIKFVRADAVPAAALLDQWQAAARLQHPHLVQLFEMGRCQVGGQEYLFLVMEYAEQTLAQILLRRALTPEETRELLLPTLDALDFLHRNQFVQGRLWPSSLLAVNDQLKLASDTVCEVGHGAGVARGSWYDPPELKERGLSAASDVWSLGMLLVEALTQRTPAWPGPTEMPSLPASMPPPYGATVRRCLVPDPADRPTAAELTARYSSASHAISPPPPPKTTPTAAAVTVAAPSPAKTAPAGVVPAKSIPTEVPLKAAAPAGIAATVAGATAAAPTMTAPGEAATTKTPEAAVVPTAAPAKSAAMAAAPTSVAPSKTARAEVVSTAAPATIRPVAANSATNATKTASADAAPTAAVQSVVAAVKTALAEVAATVAASIASALKAVAPAPVTQSAAAADDDLPAPPKRSLPMMAVAIVCIAAVPAWLSFRSSDTSPPVAPPPTVPAAAPVTPPSSVTNPALDASSELETYVAPESRPAPPPEPSSPDVINEVIPDVPPAIQEKIQGRIFVTVRVLVDPSGDVMAALMENPGPSKYFARLADNAARQWQFVPTEDQGSRVWLLRFQFTRDEVTARAMAQ